MTVQGFKLTLPNNDVFEASNVRIVHERQYQFLISGFENVTTVLETWFDDTGGQSGAGDSLMQSVFAGTGAGVHTITVDFTQWEGSTDTWTGSNDGDSAPSKLQTLDRAIGTTRIDSENLATLETFEYSSSGKFGGIPVAVLQTNLEFDVDQEVSTFGASITFAEAADLALDIDLSETRDTE